MSLSPETVREGDMSLSEGGGVSLSRPRGHLDLVGEYFRAEQIALLDVDDGTSDSYDTSNDTSDPSDSFARAGDSSDDSSSTALAFQLLFPNLHTITCKETFQWTDDIYRTEEEKSDQHRYETAVLNTVLSGDNGEDKDGGEEDEDVPSYSYYDMNPPKRRFSRNESDTRKYRKQTCV